MELSWIMLCAQDVIGEVFGCFERPVSLGEPPPIIRFRTVTPPI
jgi:hypothetical protein